LSSDVVSIAFAHFLNTEHPSLEYGIKFFSIDTLENVLQIEGAKKVTAPSPYLAIW
jgi:hypothetical protein